MVTGNDETVVDVNGIANADAAVALVMVEMGIVVVSCRFA